MKEMPLEIKEVMERDSDEYCLKNNCAEYETECTRGKTYKAGFENAWRLLQNDIAELESALKDSLACMRSCQNGAGTVQVLQSCIENAKRVIG